MTWLSALRRWRTRHDRVDGRRAREILEAYSACLDLRAPGQVHRPEADLPHSKEDIGRAIVMALRVATAPQAIEPLRQGFAELERFVDADEWAVIGEHQRLGASASTAMPPERLEEAERLLRGIEERRARRLELLDILARENAD